MPARTNETAPMEPNHEQASLAISRIFDQAQVSTANHRKNYVALYKLHLEFAEYKELLNKGRLQKLTGERRFQALYEPMVMRVLPTKKGVASGDRIVKFIAGYIKFINEKAAEEKQDDDVGDDDDDDDTMASRFTAHLLKLLLKGFVAKDKNVRYRVVQTVAEKISHLGQIDEDIYTSLRGGLIERIHDKESSIRNQAVVSLAKLCVSEDPADLNGEPSMLDVLLDSLAHDPSSDVRRTVLLTIPINDQTLNAVLGRTRDTDATIRKIVYSGVLAAKTGGDDEEESNIIGPTHPRTLTIAQRELIVRNGLGDRDPSVRTAAGTLIATWVDVVNTKVEDAGVKIEDHFKEKFEDGILSLLTLFDFGEGTIAEDALLSVFKTRVDIFNNIEFNGAYWADLTPEKAFLARVFVEHCKNNKDETRLEATLPVVTSLAFRIQEAYNSLNDFFMSIISGGDDDDERNKREDERIARELVISELLRLAVHLDYSDEIGRRKTLQLVRNMLKTEALPENLMAPCLDVLRTLASSERELIRLVVETIQELRDAVSGEEGEIAGPPKELDPETSFEEHAEKPVPLMKSTEDMSPEQKAEVDQIDLRCLSLCIGMLERVNSTFEENITLDGVLKGLIIPAVQRKESIFRERGLKSLGLCCLIARRLALQSIGIFMNHLPASSSAIKITLLQSLFDSFMVHENALFKNQENNLEAVTKFLLNHILEEEDPKVKAILCEGTSKLILSGMITSIEAVKTLVKTYLSPLTTGNQELRQCLAFFFQVYSYSSSENQKRMSNIFIHVFLDVSEDRKEARESDEDLETIGSAQVVAMFMDWTDPLRLLEAINARGTQNEKGVDECVQLSMAEDILKLLFEKDLKVDIEKDDKKVLCQLLNKLHVPDVVDDYRIRSLKLLMDTLRMRRPLRDSACNNAFTKFELGITKKFEKQLEGFTEAEYRKLEELNELFEFLDSIIPLDDDDELIDVPRKGRKRRSESITSTTTGSRSVSPPSKKDRNKPKAKRARLSTSDGDDDQRTEMGTPPPPTTAPTRTLPKRAAAAKKPVQVVVISSDSEQEYTPPTSGRKKTRARSRSSVKEEEAEVDKQIDDLLTSNATLSSLSEIPHDSIMDPDSEEEEEEVNDLLAED